MTEQSGPFVQLMQQWWWIPWVLSIGQWLMSGVVSSMDMPDQNSSAGYRFAFKFMNYIVANPFRAKAASQPSLSDDVISQKTTTTKQTVVSVPSTDPDKKDN